MTGHETWLAVSARLEREAVGTITMEGSMKTTSRTYVLTLNSPSKKGLRLWMGENIHALRHCSVKQIGLALREMQQNVDSLQAPISSSGGSYSLNRGR
jgi:hypothetical protein